MGDIFESLSGMDPEAVLAEIAIFVKKLFQKLDEEVRARFLTAMLDAPAGDKVSSLVHL